MQSFNTIQIMTEYKYPALLHIKITAAAQTEKIQMPDEGTLRLAAGTRRTRQHCVHKWQEQHKCVTDKVFSLSPGMLICHQAGFNQCSVP